MPNICFLYVCEFHLKYLQLCQIFPTIFCGTNIFALYCVNLDGWLWSSSLASHLRLRFRQAWCGAEEFCLPPLCGTLISPPESKNTWLVVNLRISHAFYSLVIWLVPTLGLYRGLTVEISQIEPGSVTHRVGQWLLWWIIVCWSIVPLKSQRLF